MNAGFRNTTIEYSDIKTEIFLKLHVYNLENCINTTESVFHMTFKRMCLAFSTAFQRILDNLFDNALKY